MRIVSWNINSVRARLPRLLALLKRHNPDVVCLQETKVLDRYFPLAQIGAMGYYSTLYGQASYNGVAILVRGRAQQHNLIAFEGAYSLETHHADNASVPTGVLRSFPNDPIPSEARVISAIINGFRLVNVYVVNGEDITSDKFDLKRRWMEALGAWLQALPLAPPLLVVGDFNVAPEDRDVWDPKGLRDRIHCTLEERAWLKKLQGKRLKDLLRETTEDQGIYTWWPYMRDGFNQNEGFRFDLALSDSALISQVKQIWVDREERRPTAKLIAPSDHAPVIIDLTEHDIAKNAKQISVSQ